MDMLQNMLATLFASPDIFYHTAAFLVFGAFLFTDILWLRALYVLNSLIFVYVGYQMHFTAMLWWNILYTVVNVIQIARIVYERRHITIPVELRQIYESSFSVLRTKEFMRFYNYGEKIQYKEGLILKAGTEEDYVLLITSGKVSVIKNHKEICILDAGHFIGEMRFITEAPISADIEAIGEVHCVRWSKQQLLRIQKLSPDVYMKLQMIFGRDLISKLRLSEQALGV